MDNTPQDFLSQQAALPTEQAEIQADPFSGANHASLPGSPKNEQYNYGADYNGLASLGGLPQGVGIGVESGQEGLMRDSMAGVYPNPIQPFPHVAPGYETLQEREAMSGITFPSVQVTMGNENMYYSGLTNEVLSFHEMNAQPEIAPEK